MKTRVVSWLTICLLLGLALGLGRTTARAQGEPPLSPPLLTGEVYDEQGQPIAGASVSLLSEEGALLVRCTTQPDGRYALSVPQPLSDGLTLRIDRAHFEERTIPLDAATIQRLRNGESVLLSRVELPRHLSAGFWIASLVFVGVLTVIAVGALHNTLAALLGMALLFVASMLGPLVHETLFIFDFAAALSYVDWNVIFLIMGMMIVIAVVEKTGIFQWLAFAAYRVSGGRIWLLLPILMLIAGVASAFLDNVTTMLLMTPMTIQIALALDINPLALLMPEVMASNVVGISTLVGTPTNILIGSYAGISFNAFLQNLTVGVLMAFAGLVVYSAVVYWKDLRRAGDVSEVLLQKLADQAQIAEPSHLKKAGWVGLGMLILFVFGEHLHLPPAVTALIGATALLVWIRPNIEEMIAAVDWTTLVFFISLFVVVGGIQEVGLISMIASLIGRLVGGSLLLAMLVVTWSSALLSTVVANIPFTAAMLPVIGYLSAISGAPSNALFYCLAVGSAMGGNGSLIGASANMVTAGISERAGYPIRYLYFLKRGFPALLITVSLATLWLLIRFVW